VPSKRWLMKFPAMGLKPEFEQLFAFASLKPDARHASSFAHRRLRPKARVGAGADSAVLLGP